MARDVAMARAYYSTSLQRWEWWPATAGLNNGQKTRQAMQRTPVYLRPKGSPSLYRRHLRLYLDPQGLGLKMSFEGAAAGALLLLYSKCHWWRAFLALNHMT